MVIPNRVVIVGGTHGNEWAGIKIVTLYQSYFRNKFPSLKLEFIFANPVAHELNSRFKDEDLNRAFQYLHEDRPNSYEHSRAKDIKEIIKREPCLVLDLHTTTSNMGKTLIVSQYNRQNLSICEKLTRDLNNCRVIGAPDPQRKYLASQSDFGLILEVGAVANSVVGGESLESTLLLIESILKQVEGQKISEKSQVELFEEMQEVHFPKNEKGEISGYIHPHFQGKDFLPLTGKITPFKNFEGEEVTLILDQELFPIFINEAAYYPQQLAFILCKKKSIFF